jgi:hypothetical protein
MTPTKKVIILSIAAAILFVSTLFLLYLNLQKPVSIPAPSLIPVTNSTSDWKTVVNTTLGISFKYPPTWRIRAYAGDQENFNNDETTYTHFSVGDESSPGIYINFGRNNDSSLSPAPAIQGGQVKMMSTGNQTIDGIVFKKQVYNLYLDSSPEDMNISVSLNSKSKNLIIGISYPKFNEVENENTINLILSTFKFDDSASILKQTGKILGIKPTSTGWEIEFNLLDMLSVSDCLLRNIPAPGGYCLINSGSTENYSVSPAAVLTTLNHKSNFSLLEGQIISDKFSDFYNRYVQFQLHNSLFDIEIVNNQIIKISEHFLP